MKDGEKVPVFVDMSTNRPELSRKFNQTFSALGSCALDAPVSGGGRGLRIVVDSVLAVELESSIVRTVASQVTLELR